MRLSLVVLLLFWPAVLLAQDDVLEPTDAQRKLNKSGVEQLVAGDYDAAIASFQSALALGELNITLINLGRAYQKAGECQRAAETWDRIPDAPVVPNPSVEELAVVLERYQNELAQCRGSVTFSCHQDDVEIEIAGEKISCATEFQSRGGTLELSAVWKDQQQSITVTVPGDGSSKTVEIDFEAEQDVAEVPDTDNPKQITDPPPASTVPWLKIIGWSSVGIGGALLTAFVGVNYGVIAPKLNELEDVVDAEVFDKTTDRRLRREIDDAQTANIVLLGVGGALVFTGATLLIVDAVSGEDVNDQATVFFNGDSGGVAYRVRW